MANNIIYCFLFFCFAFAGVLYSVESKADMLFVYEESNGFKDSGDSSCASCIYCPDLGGPCYCGCFLEETQENGDSPGAPPLPAKATDCWYTDCCCCVT